MSEWRPIETADLVPGRLADKTAPVLLANAQTGSMRVAPPCVFTADDGKRTFGAPSGFGIWIATHWMELPEPPVSA